MKTFFTFIGSILLTSLSLLNAQAQDTVCANTQPAVWYSTASVAGATSYIWTVTGGATFTANGNDTLNANLLTVNVNWGTAPFGTYQLCVQANNTCGSSSPTCMTVVVANCIPTAVDDNGSGPEDNPVTIYILQNDLINQAPFNISTIDLDPSTPGQQITASIPGQGNFVVDTTTGILTFTPEPGFNGTVNPIYYTVTDDLGAMSNIAAINVIISPVNDPPIARNDYVSTLEDTPILINLLANDTDPDGVLVPGTTQIITQPLYGIVSVDPITGQANYVPNLNENGLDSFQYVICDNGMPVLCDTAWAIIDVIPVNDPPVVVDNNASTFEDTPVTFNITANDSDVDGTINPATIDLDPSTAGQQTSFAIPGQGTFTVNTTTGDVTFTPVANFNGPVTTVPYSVCDNGTPLPVQCGQANINVTVVPVNDPPVANDDSGTTPEDTPITSNVLSNDTDLDGVLVPATVTVTSQPANGTVSVNPTTGQITYTPDPGYNGTDTYDYQVCDNGSPVLCDDATVTITILPVNDAPTVVDNSATTPEDTPVTFNITANDSDTDGAINPATIDIDPSTAGQQTSFAIPGQGTFTVNTTTGDVTFTPVAGFSGTVTTVPYSVCDNGTPLPAQCGQANINVTVVPVNDPPVANDDNGTTPEDTPITTNVLSNDTDSDGVLVPSTVFVTAQPSNGTLSVNPTTGQITYTPNPGYNGTDTYDYQVCDNGSPVLCDVATVTIIITPVNDPPMAADNSAVTPEDTPVTFNITGNDSDTDGNIDPATIDLDPSTPGQQTSFAIPGQGTFTVNTTTGDVTFTPVTNFNGTVNPITYSVCDDGTPLPVQCTQANIYVAVGVVNDAPVANDDSGTTPEDTPITTNVLSNDTDSDGVLVPSTVIITAQPSNGVVSVNPTTGEITYTPNSGYNGTDTYDYQVCDNGIPVLCDDATVTITIVPVNDAPSVVDNSATTPEDTPVTFNITANDSDTDGAIDPATIDLDPSTAGQQTSFAIPGQGTFTVNTTTGNVTFTPVANFNGTVTTVPYSVCDNGTPLPAQCGQANINVTVVPVNDGPVANDDSGTTPEDTPITTNVLSNDTDLDGVLVPSTVIVTSQPSNGTVTVNPTTGAITYTPDPGYNGTDTYDYQVCDNGSPVLCDDATVTITIVPVNDAPTVVDNSATTPEDVPVTFNIIANDSDTDGAIDPASIDLDPSTAGQQTSFTIPGQGTFTVNTTTGDVTFTPIANFNGTVTTVPYGVCDNGTPLPALCGQANINVTVVPVNDGPVANDDNGTTPEDTPITTNVLSNDTDLDGVLVPSTVTITSQPSNGTVSVNPTTGSITYTPDPGYNGTDTYDYQVCDNGSPVLCDDATVTITIVPVNDAPTVVDNSATTPEDTPVTFNITANDSDTDGAINPATIDLDPSAAGQQTSFTISGQGTFTVNTTTGNVTFTPVANFNGTVTTVPYSVCDNGTPLPALCGQANIDVTVVPVNDPPVALNNSTVTLEDTPAPLNLLSNDSDLDGVLVPSTTTVITSPLDGTVTVDPTTGQAIYTPDPNFNGVDSFQYYVCDNGSPVLCDTAWAFITVNPINDLPVALDNTASTLEDTPVTFNITANDSDSDGNIDPATIDLDPATPGQQTSFAIPGQGTFTVNTTTGNVTFTPVAGFNGTVTPVAYSVCDDGTPLPAQCDEAMLFVSVVAVNDPPVALNNSTTTPEDNPVTLNLLNNDSDSDGVLVPSTTTVITQPLNGTVSVDPLTGQALYTPDPHYYGVDSFQYAVCDNGSPVLCDTAWGFITVTPVNDPPVGTPTPQTTPEDTPITVCVPYTDPDAIDTHTAVACAGLPANGAITAPFTLVAGEICFEYTPNSNFNGTDEICITLCDDGTPVLCSEIRVPIVVTGVNDEPVAVDDSGVTPEDTPITINALANDSDPDGNLDPATTQVIDGPANGSASVNPLTGQVTYTPNPGFNGQDTMTYVVCDGGMPLLCDTADIVITVIPVNDPPVATPTPQTTPEDTPITVCVPYTDQDPGDTHTAVACGGFPANGTLTSGPTVAAGQICFEYTPDAGFNGQDEVCITLCDDGTPVLCTTVYVPITVVPVNDPPVALDNSAVTPEDVPVTINLLNNDSDPDNNLNPSTTQVVDGPSNGSVSINPTTGQATYTPTPGFNGLDTFSYVICDTGIPVYCDTADVIIGVNSVNDSPIAVDDFGTTPEDTPITIGVASNDSDPDGAIDSTTVTVINGPFNGTVTVDPVTGDITYTPNPNFGGQDSFQYEVCDNGTPVLCDIATVTINVVPVNDPPIAVDDSGVTPEDTPITTNVLANDSDIEGLNPASVQVITLPSNGSTSVNPVTGQITYTPDPQFNGTDTYEYVVCDNGTPALCDTAEVVITVIPVNDPPVATPTPQTTPEDTPITVCVPFTDQDPGDTHTAVACGGFPANGTLTSGPTVAAGQVCFEYTPAPGFNGQDEVCITLCDDGTPQLCTTFQVPITVTPVNDAPVAVDDSGVTPEDVPVTVNLLSNDSDPDNNLNPATTQVTSNPSNGLVSINPATGQATYTPNPGFNGQDTFSYVICDSGMPVLCDTADVVITVLPVNDPPVVVDDFGTTPEDTPITITVTGNDSDPDGNIDPSTLVVVGGPLHGTVTVDTVTGSVTYTPNPNFTGLDSFSYEVCDNGTPVLCEVATVVINVTPVNDPPVANDNNATTPEDTPVLVNVLNNDSDTEGLDPSSVQVISGPANGTVSVNPTTGQITYTPGPDFTGQDTFSYVVCDNGTPVLCDTADVVITVNPVNDPPVAQNDNATTGENQPLTGNVLPNDTDVDGNLDTTSVILISGPTNGTLVLNPDGTFTYTPDPNFVGTDQFTYEVCDTGIPVYCDQAVMVITVAPLCPGDLAIDSILPVTAVICNGGGGTLEVIASSSAGMTNATYVWTAPNGFVQTGQVIQVNHSGVYTVTVTDDAGCTVVGNVDVLDATPVALNPELHDYVTCENEDGPLVHPLGSLVGSQFRIYLDNFLNTEVAGGPYNMFDFNDPVFAAAAGFSNVTGLTTPLLFEYYVVEEYTVAGVTCYSPPVLFGITVNPVPPTPAPLSNSAICAGETLQLTTGVVPGATYSWTGPNGYSSTEQNPYIVDATPAHSGTYGAVVTNAYGCVSDTGFVTVVVNPGVVIDSITGGGTYCSGDDITITAFPSMNTNVTYTWYGQNGLVLQNQTGPSITFTSSVPVQSGTYTLVVTNEFGCESEPYSILLNIVPQPVTPAIVANTTVLCEGQTLTLSTSPYTGTPVSYEWFFNGQSIGSTTIAQFVIANTTAANSGVYSVVVTVDGCSSLQSAPVAITVNAAPVAVAGSNSPVCVGAQIQLDATFNPNWSYQWTGPAGFFSTLRNPVINSATLANAGDYTLLVTNLVTGCQATNLPVVSVVVAPIPATPTVQNNGPVCIGSDYTLFVSADSTAGATYNWYDSLTNVLVGTSTANNGALTITSSTPGEFGYYVIATSAAGCSSSASNFTTVRVDYVPFDDAYAGENDWSCGQNFITLGAVNPTQGTGVWSQSLAQAQSGVAIISDVNPNTIVTNLLPGENYFYWTMSNGACTDYSSDTVMIWYETAPVANYDSVYVDQNSGTLIEVLLNDDVTIVDEWVVTILEQPLTGAATVNADGTISYTAGTNVFGFDQFVYQLCSEHCPALCDTAVVIVKIGESVGCDVPNIITPNNDGLNDLFTIHCLNEYPDNELLIFNRWGDQVFNAAPYRNDWGGTFNNNLLPEGTYFYILNLGDGSTPMSGYVVIHR